MAKSEFDRRQSVAKNLNSGDLVKRVNIWGEAMGYGYVVRKTQNRQPHRTDVYLVKMQNTAAAEVDERWLVKIDNE